MKRIVLTLMFGTASAVAQINLTNGLVGYYPFDGNAADYSGRGHDAQLTRASYASDRFGRPNAALDLRGTNNWGQLPRHADFLIATNDFAWAVWLKYGPQTNNGYAAGYSAVLVKASTISPWPGPTIFVDATPGRLDYRIEQAGESASSAAALNDNTWRHFTLVRSGSNLLLYVNGTLDSSTTAATILNLSTTEPIWIGANHQNQTAQNYDGLLDELRIYNRALSPSEVAQLFAGPRVDLVKAVRPSFSNLEVGMEYQLQVSADLSNWMNYGTPFTATSSAMVYPEYWDVQNWGSLFFRVLAQ